MPSKAVGAAFYPFQSYSHPPKEPAGHVGIMAMMAWIGMCGDTSVQFEVIM